jgi:hypothetical protein
MSAQEYRQIAERDARHDHDDHRRREHDLPDAARSRIRLGVAKSTA